MYYRWMKMDMKFDASADSPQISGSYKSLSKDDRKSVIAKSIPVSYAKFGFEVVECHDDGSVYFSCASLPVSERGAILLDLESHLKSETDPAITVWLSPLGDRSALRKLRGVSINTIKKNTD